MPVPIIPPVQDVMSFTFLLDSFILAVLGFCISLSMGKPIAKMFNYELDATDELWAEVSEIIFILLLRLTYNSYSSIVLLTIDFNYLSTTSVLSCP